MNKRLAIARLAALFEDEQKDKIKKSRSDLRHSHWELERGNPIRVYDAETMKLIREKKND
jgi:peptide chain release factor